MESGLDWFAAVMAVVCVVMIIGDTITLRDRKKEREDQDG